MTGPRYHPSLLDGSLDHLGGGKQRPPAQHASGRPASGGERSEGERLATIERKDGEELRIERSSFNGYPFIDLRVWFKGDDGEWRPTKKGMSIKPRELDEVIGALSKAKGR